MPSDQNQTPETTTAPLSMQNSMDKANSSREILYKLFDPGNEDEEKASKVFLGDLESYTEPFTGMIRSAFDPKFWTNDILSVGVGNTIFPPSEAHARRAEYHLRTCSTRGNETIQGVRRNVEGEGLAIQKEQFSSTSSK